MWLARNRYGNLHCFEKRPRRYHEGPTLSRPYIGFNDDVYIKDGKLDIYSFWAVQDRHNSNEITSERSHGFRLLRPCGEKTFEEYEPEWAKEITWEDEPVEVELIPSKISNKFIFEILNLIEDNGYHLSIMQECVLTYKLKELWHTMISPTEK